MKEDEDTPQNVNINEFITWGMHMTKILIVEDERAISDLIKLNMELIGFEAVQAFDGDEGLNALRYENPDLVLLDIMLPRKGGFEILPELTKSDTPVIILSAMDGLTDRVKGLNMGADDYITKPFESIELIARINAVLRRRSKSTESNKSDLAQFDDISICFESMEVTKAGIIVDLTFKEFELLKIMVQNKGMVLSRSKLLERVWQYDYEGNTRTVDMHVQKLRQKLGTDRIATVYKVGYRFNG